MTVKELREKLDRLERAGWGNTPVIGALPVNGAQPRGYAVKEIMHGNVKGLSEAEVVALVMEVD